MAGLEVHMVSDLNSEMVEAVVNSKPNRMDRRRLETRNKLLAATLKLVTDKGVEKTTMSDISDAADLGRRTFYNHFTSKEECIIAAAVGELQKLSIKVMGLISPNDDPALVVATSTQFVMRSLTKQPIVMCLVDNPRMLGAALFAAVGQFVHQDMEKGIEQKRFNPPLRGQLLDNMMKWTLVGLLVENTESDAELAKSLVGYSQAFLMILGLGNEEAEAVSLLAEQDLKGA